MSIDRLSQHIDPNWWKTKPVYRKLLSLLYRPGTFVDLLREAVTNCSTYGPRLNDTYGFSNQLRDLYGQCQIAWSYGFDPADWFAYEYHTMSWSEISQYADIIVLQGWLNERHATAHHLDVCTDKLKFHRFCASHDIPSIPMLAVAENGSFRTMVDEDTSAFRSDLVVKESGSKGGDGIQIYTFENEAYLDDAGTRLTWDALRDRLAGSSKRTDAPIIVQPRVRNHESWQPFTSGGLATVRLLTGRYPDGRVDALAASLRMPVGDSPLDNFSQGNLASAIDLDTGVLGAGVSKYPLRMGKTFQHHPDTGATIEGAKLQQWPAIRARALSLHRQLQIPVLGLDVTLTPHGACAIEANPYYGRSSLEIPHELPLAEMPFADVTRAWMTAQTEASPESPAKTHSLTHA